MSDEAIKLEVINAALSAVGDSPKATLGSGSANAEPLEQNYENIVEAALTSGPEWRFATKTEAPTLIGARSMDVPYSYEWSLPNDSLEIRVVTVDLAVVKHWDIESDGINKKLLIDYDRGVLVRHTFRAGETSWHPAFKRGIQYMLEGVAVRAFWEDENAAEKREANARAMFAVAAARQGHRRSFESRSIRRRRYGRPPS